MPVATKTIAFAEGTDAGTRDDMERRFKPMSELLSRMNKSPEPVRTLRLTFPSRLKR